MARSITIRLNGPARELQGEESIGFSIRAGVQCYDRQIKKEKWTNYSAVVFAKPEAQADYYCSVLVEGGIVEIARENIRANAYQGQNDQSITLELLNARIGSIISGNNQQQQGNNHQNNPEYDDSIPF